MGQVNQPTNLLDQIRELRREVAEIRKAIGLTSATIQRGGLTLLQDAFIRMVDDNNDEILFIGPNFDGRQAIVINREGADPVMSVLGPAGEPMQWRLWDRNSNTLVSDDPTAGGLGRPWLAFTMHPLFAMPPEPYSYMNIPVTSVSAETALWEGRIGLVSHPRLAVSGVFGQASGSNTQIYRLKEPGGNTIGEWRPGPLINDTLDFDIRSYMDRKDLPIQLTVQATGTGTVACQVFSSYQRGTVS